MLSQEQGGQGIRQRLRARFRAWVNRRIPPARAVTLDQRRIFIFPSRAGFFFGLSLLLMLTTAINYQNNMSYALTFLLSTLFIIATLAHLCQFVRLDDSGVARPVSLSGTAGRI